MGIYLGLLVGVIPALVSWALGFSFKYFTGITVPGFGVVVLAIALAGVSGAAGGQQAGGPGEPGEHAHLYLRGVHHQQPPESTGQTNIRMHQHHRSHGAVMSPLSFRIE